MTTETTQARPPEYGAATGSEFHLPVVHGRRSSGSNADFERACLVHIERLQHGLGPYDSAMMATFCEAVRMVREYSDAMQVRTPNAGLHRTEPAAGLGTVRGLVGSSESEGGSHV